LSQYRAKRAGWQIFVMYRHDCLPAGDIAMPQEMMRSFDSNYLEAGPLKRCDHRAAGQRRQRPHDAAAATGTN
jgi:hypothetical protein